MNISNKDIIFNYKETADKMKIRKMTDEDIDEALEKSFKDIFRILRVAKKYCNN